MDCALRGPGIDRARQLECEERVPAGDLGDSHHRRPRERSPETRGDQRVQAAQAQRADTHPFDAVGSGQLQPRHRASAVGIRPLGDQQPDPPLNRRAANASNILAGPIQPLQIVDGDQHGRVRGEAVEYRRKGRRHDALIGGVILAAGSQQHPVDGDALHVGQLGEDGGVNVAEEVCHRRIGEHRLRLPHPRGENPVSAVARLLDGGQPQRGLADAGLALDDQSGRLLCCRPQELRYRRNSSGRLTTAGIHDPHHLRQQTETTSRLRSSNRCVVSSRCPAIGLRPSRPTDHR